MTDKSDPKTPLDVPEGFKPNSIEDLEMEQLAELERRHHPPTPECD